MLSLNNSYEAFGIQIPVPLVFQKKTKQSKVGVYIFKQETRVDEKGRAGNIGCHGNHWLSLGPAVSRPFLRHGLRGSVVGHISVLGVSFLLLSIVPFLTATCCQAIKKRTRKKSWDGGGIYRQHFSRPVRSCLFLTLPVHLWADVKKPARIS